jgi:hypothetical protein
VSASADKVALLDAIGIHFGKDLWKQFTPTLVADFRDSLRTGGIVVKEDDGDFSASIPAFCQHFSNWRIGLLQGTNDVILTKLFGKITISEFRRKLLGPQGLHRMTLDPNDNCSSWIMETYMHMFLYLDTTLDWKVEGVSAKDFANALINGTNRAPMYSVPRLPFTGDL